MKQVSSQYVSGSPSGFLNMETNGGNGPNVNLIPLIRERESGGDHSLPHRSPRFDKKRVSKESMLQGKEESALSGATDLKEKAGLHARSWSRSSTKSHWQRTRTGLNDSNFRLKKRTKDKSQVRINGHSTHWVLELGHSAYRKPP